MKPKTGKDLNKKSNDKVKNESDNETDKELELVLDYDSSDEMIKEVEKVIRKNKPKVEKTDEEDKGVIKQEAVKKVVTGEAFKKLGKKAKKLGATSLGYSNRVNNKYVVEYDGKKKHFGSIKKDDFLIHGDEKKREKYLERVKKITNKDGEYTYEIPRYSNFWCVNLLY